MAYARVGLIWSHFEGPDQTKRGFQAGGGLQLTLTDVWHVRGEYVNTAYSTLGDVGTPRTGEYAIGITYTFC